MEKEIAVRTIDKLGRVILPAEIRHKFNLSTNDKVKIIEKGNKILIEKYKPSCAFCGGGESLVMLNDKYVCEKCRQIINSSIESWQKGRSDTNGSHKRKWCIKANEMYNRIEWYISRNNKS